MTTPASRPRHSRYDAVVAGARCAGASTGMLLARAGLRVLVVDPVPEGRDTLSTHALMWAGVLQLQRWGLLDSVREAGTPRIPTTTFHYGEETVPIPLKPKGGVEGLYAPRRTVLDPILVEGARAAGAEVVHGLAVADLLRDRDGHVRGAVLEGAGGTRIRLGTELVVGADGIRSRVARILGAELTLECRHAGASIYGYLPDPGMEGYHWHFAPGGGAGVIPTDDGESCVFVGFPARRFNRAVAAGGLEAVFHAALRETAPGLARRVEAIGGVPRLRAWAGAPGFLRRSAGPGWALVGDAGYFKDPITAHGISDALRDAELLARTVATGGDLVEYELQRNALVRELLDITDRIAAYDWTLDEAKELHLALAAEMKREVRWMDATWGAPGQPVPRSRAAVSGTS